MSIPLELRETAAAKLDAYRTEKPGLFFIPNIGQEKAFLPYKEPPYPYIMVFGGGNGVGKSAALAILACGCVFGKDEVSDFFDGYQFFDDLEAKEAARGKHRPLMFRIVCHADSMKEGGSVLQAIKDWFPKGRYKLQKHGKTYYSQIECDNGRIIDIKTHDQEKGAHSGTTLDGILFDEPPPEQIYGESVGRTRNGGWMAFFLTPLEMAAWMMDQILDQADGKRVYVTNASLWDNCKDIPGTRGHLPRESIENMIREWTRIGPHEIEARVNGLFTHLAGAIYKTFNPQVHGIRSFPIPEEWPVYCILDPHDSKPPAFTWIAQSPTNAFVIREWPTEDFTKLGNLHHTIEQIAQIVREIEAPFRHQVIWRFMDPNKGRTNYANTQRTVQEEYGEQKLYFELSEDDLQVGHQRVTRMLHYDIARPVETPNTPYLYVFNDCFNTMNALHKYGIKRGAIPGTSLTAQIDKKFKDFADNPRYFAMRLQSYRPVQAFTEFYDTIMRSRVKK